MSKKEFVDAYAKATGETKKRSEELVNQFLETVEKNFIKRRFSSICWMGNI